MAKFFKCIVHKAFMLIVFSSGAAVGASSVLLIRPMNCTEQPPKGVIVAVLVNLQEVDLGKTAMAVAACFEKTQP